MRAVERAASLDALRALALMPVVVVNLSGYAALPDGGPLPAVAPAGSLAAWAAVAVVATLLQGKGLAFLTFLFGYSLVLGARARPRLNRLMGVGLAHGFLLYCGDILSTYAAAGYAALKFRCGRLVRLRRRMLIWGGVGIVLLGAVMLGGATLADSGAPPPALSLAAPQAFGTWWAGNAKQYAAALLVTVLVYLPVSYAMVLAGVMAARLRLLTHRRWRPLWQRWARWAPLLLLVNGVYGLGMAHLSATDPPVASLCSGLMLLLGPLTVMTWVPWLLLRTLPAWLSRAGRNTLSVYVGSSVIAVTVLSGAGLAWRPGTVEGVLFALLVWLGLAGLSAWATARGLRLPLEAWLARRPAAAP